MIKNNKGITVISLIVTLVLMLVITYITIRIVVGDDGVVGKAENVKTQSEVEDIKEKIYLSVLKNTSEDGKIDINAIKDEVEKDNIEIIELKNNLIKFKYNEVEYTVDVNDVSDTVKAGYNNSSTPNAPYLMSGMQPIKWDSNGTEVPTNENDKEWYNYDKQLWANAKTVEDESYWVWIPRYEYKITYYTDETKTIVSDEKTLYGKIDVNFIPKEKTMPTEGYKIHPAFTDGTDNYFDNGEWDKEVSGIWVSKYEIGCETSTDGINWVKSPSISNGALGNKLSKNAGGEEYVRAVSKSSTKQTKWNWITIGGAYTNSYYYDREKESHLIKNSEFGAVSYLSYSKYGTNGENLTNNNSTGNETGIFYTNMQIFTAGYIADGISFNSDSYVVLGNFFNPEKYIEEGKERDKCSTKYITRYAYDPEVNYKTLSEYMFSSNENFKYLEENYSNIRYGDAFLETSKYYLEGNSNRIKTWGEPSSGSTYLSGCSQEGAQRIITRCKNENVRLSFSSGYGNAGLQYSYMITLIGE